MKTGEERSMKALRIVSVLSVVALCQTSVAAQDPVKVDAAHYKVLVDNPSVRVLKISYPAGAKSTMHQHPESLVVPLVASKVTFTSPDGKSRDQELANESASFAPAETKVSSRSAASIRSARPCRPMWSPVRQCKSRFALRVSD